MYISNYELGRILIVNYIANPVGGALGQLLSPQVGNTRQSVRFSNFNFVVVLGWHIDLPKYRSLS